MYFSHFISKHPQQKTDKHCPNSTVLRFDLIQSDSRIPYKKRALQFTCGISHLIPYINLLMTLYDPTLYCAAQLQLVPSFSKNKKYKIQNKLLISVLALRAPAGLHVTFRRKMELGVTLTQARRETEVVRRWQCGCLVSPVFHCCCQSAQEGSSSRVMLRLRPQHFI